MPLDGESEAYVLAMTFLLRTPGAHIQRVICDPAHDVPRPLEELFASTYASDSPSSGMASRSFTTSTTFLLLREYDQ